MSHVIVENSRKKTNSLECNDSGQQDRWFALNGANRRRNAEYLIVNTSLAKIKDLDGREQDHSLCTLSVRELISERGLPVKPYFSRSEVGATWVDVPVVKMEYRQSDTGGMADWCTRITPFYGYDRVQTLSLRSWDLQSTDVLPQVFSTGSAELRTWTRTQRPRTLREQR